MTGAGFVAFSGALGGDTFTGAGALWGSGVGADDPPWLQRMAPPTSSAATAEPAAIEPQPRPFAAGAAATVGPEGSGAAIGASGARPIAARMRCSSSGDGLSWR